MVPPRFYAHNAISSEQKQTPQIAEMTHTKSAKSHYQDMIETQQRENKMQQYRLDATRSTPSLKIKYRSWSN
jgi:hypothetical protein